eukprot:10981868-Alexandrium_andersonii.AAC.1
MAFNACPAFLEVMRRTGWAALLLPPEAPNSDDIMAFREQAKLAMNPHSFGMHGGAGVPDVSVVACS